MYFPRFWGDEEIMVFFCEIIPGWQVRRIRRIRLELPLKKIHAGAVMGTSSL